jgi:phage/plasmid-like protein (TIGR03299 family)
MSHEVDTMAYEITEAPWHLSETKDVSKAVRGLQRADDMIIAAGLNWPVVKERIQRWSIETGKYGDTPWYFTVRQDRNNTLGVVGNDYTILQNKDAFRLVDDILDDSGAKYETAGSLRGGRIVWALARLPEVVTIDGTDPLVPYLLIANSHDGSKRVVITMTAVRVVCMNTLGGAIPYYSGGKWKYVPNTFAIVHRKGSIQAAAHRAREALKLSFKYFKELQELGTVLAHTEVSEGEVETFLKEIFKGDTVPSENRRDRVIELLDSPTNRAFNGTAWGLYNAVIEYADHGREGRKNNPNADDLKVERGLLDTGSFKANVLTSLVQFKQIGVPFPTK